MPTNVRIPALDVTLADMHLISRVFTYVFRMHMDDSDESRAIRNEIRKFSDRMEHQTGSYARILRLPPGVD
jgi:hypothetical protein